LGEENMRSARDTDNRAGFALEGKDWDGIYLARRKGYDLIYAGKVDHGLIKHPPPICASA
jgi:hypothetical protein